MTVNDLITEASILGGILAIGETLDGSIASYGLNKLNQMIDLWAADRLAIYRKQRAGPFAVTAGTQTYTIGTGATWNVARPLWIDEASIIVDPTVTYPVELPMRVLTSRQYQQDTVKTIQSKLPRELYYDRTFANGTIYLYPVPSTSVPQIILYIPVAVPEFTVVGTTVSLPPGYRLALISNLAMIMITGLRKMPAELSAVATKSFATLKSSNFIQQMDPLECEAAVLSQAGTGFNFYDGSIAGR